MTEIKSGPKAHDVSINVITPTWECSYAENTAHVANYAEECNYAENVITPKYD